MKHPPRNMNVISGQTHEAARRGPQKHGGADNRGDGKQQRRNMKIKQIKSIGTAIYMIGFVLSVMAMIVTWELGTNDLHQIEHCMAVFLAGAVTVTICELKELQR